MERYPWHEVKKGEGFFVPGLNVKQIRKEGMTAALLLRYKIKTLIGVKAGVYGVMFLRRR